MEDSHSRACEIVSIESLIKAVRTLGKRREQDENFSIYFRGEPEDYGDEACLPSLFRERGRWLNRERQDFNEACRRCPETLPMRMTMLDRLVEMQHYGLKTRLLDVTENLLTALYFAVSDEQKDVEDGCLYCICIPKGDVHYGRNADVQNIAKIAGYGKHSDNRFWKNIYKRNQILFFKPPFLNSRIRAQQGAMLIFGCARERKDFPRLKMVNDFSDKNKICAVKLKIPAKKKQELKKDLKLLGFSQWTFFPKIGEQNIFY